MSSGQSLQVMNENVKIVRLSSKKLIDLLEELRKTIEESLGADLAKNFSYGQLIDILVEKIRKEKITFKFP